MSLDMQRAPAGISAEPGFGLGPVSPSRSMLWLAPTTTGGGLGASGSLTRHVTLIDLTSHRIEMEMESWWDNGGEWRCRVGTSVGLAWAMAWAMAAAPAAPGTTHPVVP